MGKSGIVGKKSRTVALEEQTKLSFVYFFLPILRAKLVKKEEINSYKLSEVACGLLLRTSGWKKMNFPSSLLNNKRVCVYCEMSKSLFL